MQILKPKFWDINKVNYLCYLLQPFTIPIRINNFFLDKKNQKNSKIKTICVGNIYLRQLKNTYCN